MFFFFFFSPKVSEHNVPIDRRSLQSGTVSLKHSGVKIHSWFLKDYEQTNTLEDFISKLAANQKSRLITLVAACLKLPPTSHYWVKINIHFSFPLLLSGLLGVLVAAPDRLCLQCR